MARRERDALEMVAFARRAIKAAGRHAGDADEFELVELVSLRDDLETAIREAVHAQRRFGRSWAAIGAALGMTRQSAHEHYGRAA